MRVDLIEFREGVAQRPCAGINFITCASDPSRLVQQARRGALRRRPQVWAPERKILLRGFPQLAKHWTLSREGPRLWGRIPGWRRLRQCLRYRGRGGKQYLPHSLPVRFQHRLPRGARGHDARPRRPDFSAAERPAFAPVMIAHDRPVIDLVCFCQSELRGDFQIDRKFQCIPRTNKKYRPGYSSSLNSRIYQ